SYDTTPWVMYTPGSEAWNEWFQNRPGDVAQSKGAIGLDYSTFMDGALINYAAAHTEEGAYPKELFLKWKAYRSFSSH
ncbi:hypothetical protein KKE54_03785, partial [bacterium]|nr:hypothetical protein [bacterium]